MGRFCRRGVIGCCMDGIAVLSQALFNGDNGGFNARSTRAETASEHVACEIDLRLVALILDVKMWRIVVIKVHSDHDAEEPRSAIVTFPLV